MDLQLLRQATSAEHSSTEETVPLMADDLDHATYVDTLRRFYRVALAWDRWADSNVPVDLKPLLEGRRRATLLAEDLRNLGEPTLPADIPDAEFINNDAATREVFLGRLYVMEGSTLGGQYIARHVEEKLNLPHGVGDSYFVGYGDNTGERWRQVREVLSAVPDEQGSAVITSAKQMFEIFGAIMRQPVLSH